MKAYLPLEFMDYADTQILKAESVTEACTAILEVRNSLNMLGALTGITSLEDRDELFQSATQFYVEGRCGGSSQTVDLFS